MILPDVGQSSVVSKVQGDLGKAGWIERAVGGLGRFLLIQRFMEAKNDHF